MDMTPDQHLDTVRQLAEVKSGLSALVHSIEALSKRMDGVGTMSQEIVRLQEQHFDNSSAIKRLFERAEKRDETDDARMEAMLGVKAMTERWVNRGLGAWFIGSILFVVIQALVIDRVKSYESTQGNHAETMVTIDRRLAWIEYELKGKYKFQGGHP